MLILVRIFRVLTDVDDLIRSAVPLAILRYLHRGNSARSENIPLHIALIRLAGYLFNDPPEHAISEVRVRPVGARPISQGHVVDRLGDQLCLIPGVVMEHGIIIVSGPSAPAAWVRK